MIEDRQHLLETANIEMALERTMREGECGDSEFGERMSRQSHVASSSLLSISWVFIW